MGYIARSLNADISTNILLTNGFYLNLGNWDLPASEEHNLIIEEFNFTDVDYLEVFGKGESGSHIVIEVPTGTEVLDLNCDGSVWSQVDLTGKSGTLEMKVYFKNTSGAGERHLDLIRIMGTRS
jgi:hypothetical protein